MYCVLSTLNSYYTLPKNSISKRQRLIAAKTKM
jgi:hypothetical protein